MISDSWTKTDAFLNFAGSSVLSIFFVYLLLLIVNSVFVLQDRCTNILDMSACTFALNDSSGSLNFRQLEVHICGRKDTFFLLTFTFKILFKMVHFIHLFLLLSTKIQQCFLRFFLNIVLLMSIRFCSWLLIPKGWLLLNQLVNSVLWWLKGIKLVFVVIAPRSEILDRKLSCLFYRSHLILLSLHILKTKNRTAASKSRLLRICFIFCSICNQIWN